MTNEINTILRYFFANSDLAGIAEDELRDLSKRYPFFSVAQFLLAKKLLQNNSAVAGEQTAKASLYFNNPLWLEYILNPQPEEEAISIQHVSPGTDNHHLEEQGSETAGIENEPENETAEASTVTEAFADNAFHGDAGAHKDTATLEPVASAIENEEENKEQREDENEEEEVAFEPYHTVDYFASQGIRLQQSELRNDRLGQQLKSFTEWLRSMKRLPNSAPAEQVDQLAQQSVILSAQHSIEDREVVTETMAEVWLRQGNARKAMDIYTKLSLLNPDKSAYFAAKIDKIKLM